MGIWRSKIIWMGLVALALVLSGCTLPGTDTQQGEPVKAWSPAGPQMGFDIHAAADHHLPWAPEAFVHHYCKPFKDWVIECQLYDGDGADAKLIGAEFIVDLKTYQSLGEEEKKFWHYHKQEFQIIQAKAPGLLPEEEAKLFKGLEETYGKVYLLWDQSQGSLPMGMPRVYNLHEPGIGAAR